MLLLSLAIGLGTGCASTGGVRGRLEPAPRGRALENTVVYLVPVSPKQSTGGGTVVISENARGFDPFIKPVAVGTRVEFRNRDHVYHNAFSISPAKPFDVGLFGPGQKRSVLFDHAGVVSVFCELHPKASAFVVVVPSRYFARADASGAFHLSYVPPGAYTLKAWHPDLGEISRDVVVPVRSILRVDLSY